MKNLVLILLFFLLGLSELFSQDLIPYRIKDKWGYSNVKGEIIVPIKYDSVTPFDRSKYYYRKENVAKIFKGKFQGFIDKNGVVVLSPNKWNSIEKINLEDNVLGSGGAFNLGALKVKKGKKYGIISNTDFYIKPKFDEIITKINRSVKNGVGSIEIIILGRKKDKWFRLNLDNSIEEHEYSYTEKSTKESYSVVAPRSYGQKSKIELDFSKVKELKLDSISEISTFYSSDLKLYTVYKNGKVGLASLNSINRGKIEIKPQYDSILETDLALVKKDKFSSEIIPKYFLAKKDKKYGVIDINDRIIVPFNLDNYLNFGNNHLIYKTDDKNVIVLFDSLKRIESSKYLEIKFLNDLHESKLIKVRTIEGWGYVNYDGFEYFE